MSVLGSFGNELHHVLVAADSLFLEAFDIDSFVNIFSYIQIDGLRFQQVHDLFIVYLQEAALHQELQS